MKINQKMKNRRKEIGLTMLEVAQKVGVSEATVSRWESGDIANMRRDKIVLLAKALDVSPAFIMGWEKEPPPYGKEYTATKQIGENIKQARIRARMTIQSLADFLSISQETLKDIEDGKEVRLTDKCFNHLCQILNCTFDDLRTPGWVRGLEGYPELLDEIPEELEDENYEQNLLSNYRKLNITGKSKVNDYVSDITENEKYLKNNSDISN